MTGASSNVCCQQAAKCSVTLKCVTFGHGRHDARHGVASIFYSMAADSVNSERDTMPPPAIPRDEKPKAKKFKIKASNGWDKLPLSNGKFSDPSLMTATPIVKRPRTAKVKLSALPSLPLDVLYEVRVDTSIP